MNGRVPCYRWEGADLILKVHVQSRAKRDTVVDQHGDALRIRVAAPPVHGQANARLVGLLAETFGVGRGQVQLISGHSGRDKRLRIHAPSILPPGFRPRREGGSR
jgi:uncharacterized protein (TIGR00251 family)